ncbi:MAG: IclR family transcriptional regulator [Pararhodobacter sp.]|nr:IclR family transcriptional regulator [Pararhodobacter sp.]
MTDPVLPEYDGDESDPKFVTALSRGLSLLRSFRRNEVYLTNQIFAARTGLPKPTVTRLTYTLCKLGYLVQDQPGGDYRLGAGVMTLGYGVLAAMPLRERVEIELAAICEGDNANVAAALGERYGQSMVYLVTHRSPDSVAMTFHLGARVPLFHSSIGRALLMGLPKTEQDSLLDEACRATTDHAARARLALGLERARSDFAAHGYCTSFGDWRKEINGIAAPVVPVQGGRVYAVNVGGFAFLNPQDQLMDTYAPRLLRAAQSLALRPEADD